MQASPFLLRVSAPHFGSSFHLYRFSTRIQANSSSLPIGPGQNLRKRASQTKIPGACRRERTQETHLPGECTWQIKKHHKMQATLGLTGLTSNAMALIAPGAFLWLTFYIQATEAPPRPPCGLALSWPCCSVWPPPCLCRDIQALPGTGSSYYYAEQALLSQDKMFKYARVAKFIVGWGSHLYYWVYPAVMVPPPASSSAMSSASSSQLPQRLQSGTGVHGAGGHRVRLLRRLDRRQGAGASTAVNLAINVIQISALLVFSVLALGYRSSHPAGAPAFQYDSQTMATYDYSSPPPRTAPPSATPAATLCPCSTPPARRFLHHRLSGEGFQRQLPQPRNRKPQ